MVRWGKEESFQTHATSLFIVKRINILDDSSIDEHSKVDGDKHLPRK
jgi:hypothetical protein